MEIIKYSNEHKNIWDRFVENSKNGTFMLKRDYIDYHSDRFKDFSLLFYDKDELTALLPLSLHGNEVRSHGGLTYGGFVVGKDMKQHKMISCFSELQEYLKFHNITKLIYKAIPHIYHLNPAEEDLYALFLNDAKLYRRDVSTTITLQDPIKMPKGRKAQISRAKREGVIVLESDEFEKFIELENSVLKEHHNTQAVHTAQELRLLKSKFKEEIQLWCALHENKIIAASLIFVYKNIVHTQYMAANEKAREIGALDLLIKTLMDKFKDSKKYFDFGISTEDNGRYLNTGLISQKESFGGRSTVYDFYELKI